MKTGSGWQPTASGLCLTAMLLLAAIGSTDAAMQRPAALDAIDAHTGHWRSEDKTTQQGETFHFEYELRWIDPGQTLVKMLITRVGPNGTSTVFEGYKGRDPGGGVYYFAVSPSGRGARGRVLLEGTDLVTVYEGWTAEGDVVEIRDVFEPVDEAGDSFVSRTFLRRAPGAEWQQIGEDHWHRIDP